VKYLKVIGIVIWFIPISILLVVSPLGFVLLAAAAAVAVVILVGVAVVHLIFRINSVQSVIQITVPSPLYEIIKTRHRPIVKLSAYTVLLGIFTYVVIAPLAVCPLSAWGCGDSRGVEAAQGAELEFTQTAILSMMVDNDLTAVTASTSGAGGENISGASSQFHATITMQNYFVEASTLFCYRWGAGGRITFQYDLVSGECAATGKQLFP
jgi:hypothetical protein